MFLREWKNVRSVRTKLLWLHAESPKRWKNAATSSGAIAFTSQWKASRNAPSRYANRQGKLLNALALILLDHFGQPLRPGRVLDWRHDADVKARCIQQRDTAEEFARLGELQRDGV